MLQAEVDKSMNKREAIEKLKLDIQKQVGR